jgi:hypothetical protein
MPAEGIAGNGCATYHKNCISVLRPDASRAIKTRCFRLRLYVRDSLARASPNVVPGSGDLAQPVGLVLVWSTQYVVLTVGLRSVSKVGMVSDMRHIKYVI